MDVAIGLTSWFLCFLLPLGCVLSHLESYKKWEWRELFCPFTLWPHHRWPVLIMSAAFLAGLPWIMSFNYSDLFCNHSLLISPWWHPRTIYFVYKSLLVKVLLVAIKSIQTLKKINKWTLFSLFAFLFLISNENCMSFYKNSISQTDRLAIVVVKLQCILLKNKIHLPFNGSSSCIHLFGKISKFKSQMLTFINEHIYIHLWKFSCYQAREW